MKRFRRQGHFKPGIFHLTRWKGNSRRSLLNSDGKWLSLAWCLHACCLHAWSPEKSSLSRNPKKMASLKIARSKIKANPQNKKGLESQEPQNKIHKGSASALRWEKTPPGSSKSSSDFLFAKHPSLTCQAREKKTDDKLDKENPTRKRRTLRNSKLWSLKGAKLGNISK